VLSCWVMCANNRQVLECCVVKLVVVEPQPRDARNCARWVGTVTRAGVTGVSGGEHGHNCGGWGLSKVGWWVRCGHARHTACFDVELHGVLRLLTEFLGTFVIFPARHRVLDKLNVL